MISELPAGVTLHRTTAVFDNTSVPAGLLRAHRIADGVWGRLVVRRGSVRFVFEDEPEAPIVARPGTDVVIPPARPHHIELDEPAEFVVEFHR